MTSTSPLSSSRLSASRVRRAPRHAAEDFRTPVRGFSFAAPPPGTDVPRPGAAARLVREPANPRDPLAVAVWTTDGVPWRIGYLDRAVAARLAPRLDAGQRFLAELAGWVEAPGAVWHRPLVRVATAATDEPSDTDAAGDAPPARGAGAPADGRGARRATGPGVWARPPGSSRRVLGPGA